MPVDVQEVEGHERHWVRERPSLCFALVRHVHTLLQTGEARPAILAQRDDLAVDDAGRHSQELSDVGQLGERDRLVQIVPALGSHASPFDEEDRPDAVPFDFERPILVVRRQLPGHGQHGLDGVGKGIGPGRRAVPMDHPVSIVGLEEHEASRAPLPVEHELDFGVRPLLHVIRTGVPDRHPAAPVLALWDVALEGRIFQRMVLGVHGEVVLLRGLGQALGERPRDKDAIAFEPEIPVETARVVLLDHESLAGGLLGWPATHRLRRLLGIALGAVGVELSRIACPASTRGSRRHQVPPYP
jgi:hypothetical protein